MPETEAIIKSETFICDRCNNEFPIGEMEEFNGVKLCKCCFDNDIAECDVCRNQIWRSESMGNDSIILCQCCYDEYYYNCHDCDCLLHRDDARYIDNDEEQPLCSDCYHDHKEFEYINAYNYKPEPIFYGDGIFYGVELEIDSGGLSDNNANTILSIANRNNMNVYIKQDGSLDNGFEIVTHPMSLDYHRETMPWEYILEEAVAMGYKSHQAGTCGLHVHVDRKAFGQDEETQEAGISNVLFFIEKHWDEMLRFSRRTETQINRWASRYGLKNKPSEQLLHAKNNNIGRYACLNLSNRNTIELRIFRGTLKYQTLIATLQLVDEICRVALHLNENQMEAFSWLDFVLSIDKQKKPELIEYLKLRQLYVNEPIDEQEEDI